MGNAFLPCYSLLIPWIVILCLLPPSQTTRRAPPDRASPKQQTSSAAMNAVNTVASDVNDGRGGRSRIPNNPFTPKMEYSDNNGQGMMGVDNCRPMSFVDQESGFSSGMRVDNGSGQGLKRRVHQVRYFLSYYDCQNSTASLTNEFSMRIPTEEETGGGC